MPIETYLKSQDAAPGKVYKAITPSDSAALPNGPCRRIWVGGTGNIAIEDEAGTAVTVESIPVGMFDGGAYKIKATGTTATKLIAVY